MEDITAIVVFPVKTIKDWIFRLSITNTKTMMILARCKNKDSPIILRFFVDETKAAAFVQECSEGNYTP